ncbi:MAG: hypothetical protein D6751_06580, partial [Deltaproteobacteria bacterium]
RQRVMPRIVAKGDQRWSTGRGSFVSAVGIDTTLLLATLHVAARVQLEDGFVWYCWAPRGVDNGPDGAALITLHQARLPDGTWRLIAGPPMAQNPLDPKQWEHELIRDMLDARIDVCRAITQPDRERFFASVKRNND